MATYTMELRTLVNSPYHEVFDFSYPFYCDDAKLKEEFEELFINRFYFHEIGAETVDRWKQMLKARLMVKMPYYRQLYFTEWEQTGKNMMNSKDLTETTTHTLKSNDNGNATVNGKATDTINDITTSTQSEESSGTSSGNGTHDESYINDGTSVANTTEPYRTGSSKDVSSATSSSSGEVESSTSKNISSSNTNETKTTNTNQTTLEEKTTFHSYGDIGIQTPAYAITEWRKVIINLNEMILNDLQDLFIQIY